MFDAFLIIGIIILTVVLSYQFIKHLRYRSAEREITEWVRGYKRRCTGNNRFIVTRETLQDSFREYDSNVIDHVFNKLIANNMIQQDPMDQEWCIRNTGM